MEYPYANEYAWHVRKKAMFVTVIFMLLACVLIIIPELPDDATDQQTFAWLLLAGPMCLLGVVGVIGSILGVVTTVKVLLDDDPTDPGPLW